ncbi:MAG: hypothetical protein RMJ67_06585, partial [Elusimicrobiota bacterium]|nr:DUF2341 domain-containing protein [Endomicrobiia bacterium]MDW8166160.1 hypothetical protein [Elusimicrobiota bacterium]
MRRVYKLIFFLLISALHLQFVFSWPLPEFSFRRSITINNTASSNLANYQILLTLNTQSLISQGKMRPDCGDIRFIDSDETTLLTHYIYTNITNYTGLSYSWGILGCNSPTSFIRVVVPSIPANSIKTIY